MNFFFEVSSSFIHSPLSLSDNDNDYYVSLPLFASLISIRLMTLALQSHIEFITYEIILISISRFMLIAGEITLVRPLDEISAITHVGDPVLLTVVAEEVKVSRNEPPAMATTVQLALFLPERSNSPPYFENDQ